MTLSNYRFKIVLRFIGLLAILICFQCGKNEEERLTRQPVHPIVGSWEWRFSFVLGDSISPNSTQYNKWLYFRRDSVEVHHRHHAPIDTAYSETVHYGLKMGFDGQDSVDLLVFDGVALAYLLKEDLLIIDQSANDGPQSYYWRYGEK